jgi:hypothetical protein
MQTKADDNQVGGTHYKNGGKMQHWTFCWENNYDQFQYCITKYVHRHKSKNGLEDLYKARHHLEKYIELLEAEAEPGSGYINQD